MANINDFLALMGEDPLLEDDEEDNLTKPLTFFPEQKEEVTVEEEIPADVTDGDPQDDPNFSLDVLRRDFSRGATNMVGEALQGAAITSVSSQRRAAGKFSGEFSDPKGQSVDALGFLLSGGDVSKEASQIRKQEAAKRAPGIKELMDSSVFQAGKSVKDFAEEFFPSDERYKDTVQRKLGEGAGSLVAFALSALGTPVLTAAMGGSSNASAQFADAIEKGASFEEALKAADLGFGIGTTEALPIGGALRRLDKGTGGLFGDKLTKFIKERLGTAGEIAVNGVSGAIEEGLQEGLMDLINNVSAKDIIGYDEKRDRFEGTGESAAVGGTLGFLLNTLASSLGIGKRNIQANASARLEQELLNRIEKEDAVDQTSTSLPSVEDIQPNKEVTDGESDIFARTKQEILAELGEVGNTSALVKPAQKSLGYNEHDVTLADGQEYSIFELVDDSGSKSWHIDHNDSQQEYDIKNSLGTSLEEATSTLEKRVAPRRNLTDREIERLANLRIDSRGVAAAGQNELDLEQTAELDPTQDVLNLKRDFDKGFQFPDSNTQGELPGLSQQDTGVPQGPTATIQKIRDLNIQEGVGELGNVQPANIESPKKGITIYRGVRGDGFDPTTSREGYQVSASSSPHVAASYSGEEGLVYPITIDPKKLIEFPVRISPVTGQTTFSFTGFDQRVKGLKEGEVLVVRGVSDPGPMKSDILDPDKLWSYDSDIYAWKDSSIGEVSGEPNTDPRTFETATKPTSDPALEQPTADVHTLTPRTTEPLMPRPARAKELTRGEQIKAENDLLNQQRNKEIDDVEKTGYDASKLQPIFDRGLAEDTQPAPAASDTSPINVAPDGSFTTTNSDGARLSRDSKGITTLNMIGQETLKIAPDGTVLQGNSNNSDFIKHQADKIVADSRKKKFGVIEGGGQRPLPLSPQTLEPAGTVGPQGELALEGGGKGTGGRLPPTPPSGGGGSGGTINPTTVVTDSRGALVRTGESRRPAGEPTNITIDKDNNAVSVDGRSRKNVKLDSKADYKFAPMWSRLWLDIALTTSVLPGRADVKIMKDIVRAQATHGRALGEVAHASMNKIDNVYKAINGKSLETAPREELRLYTEYMNGQIGRGVVKEKTKANDDFLDALDNSRIKIADMTRAMVEEDMIPADLRQSFMNNIGSYIHVSYAANVLNAQDTTADILRKIPEEVRNNWMYTFQRAFTAPIRNKDLDTRSMGELRRMVKALGLTERRRAADTKEEGAEKDIVVLAGSETLTPVEHTTKEELINTLIDFGGMNDTELTNAMSRMLNSTVGGASRDSKGRERSLERRKMLARNAQELKEAGYNSEEIAYNMATRELLMETVNPVTNVGITMNKMMNSISAHRIVNDIASLHAVGLVSIGKPDSKAGLTELLVPRGSAMADVRIPKPNSPGEFIYAAPASDSASKNDGIYVSPRMARVFQHMAEPTQRSDGAINLLRAGTGLSKVALTAYNPRSHPRNAVTAAALLGLRGHAMTNPAALKAAFTTVMGVSARDLGNRTTSEDSTKAKKQDEADTILQYFTDLGLFGDSVRTGPVKELLTQVLEAKDAELLGNNTYMTPEFESVEGVLKQMSKRGKTAIGRKVSDISQKPMALFRLEDEAAKAIAFMVERRRYANMIGRQDLVDMIDGKQQMNDAQLAEMREFDKGIAKYVTDLYPTYSRVPVGIRALSRSIWVTPFPSFTAEMWRNGLNDYTDLAQLSRGTGRYENVPANKRNALLATRVATKVAYNTAIHGMVSSVTGLSLAAISAVGLDPTDDELDEAYKATQRAVQGKPINDQSIDMALRVIAPMYMTDSLFDIRKYTPGESVVLRNLAYSLPNSQQLETGYGVYNTVEMMLAHGDYDRAGKRLLSTTYKLVSDYIKPDVLAATAIEILKGKTNTGYTIYDPKVDDEWEVSMKSAQHLMNLLAPALKEAGKFSDAYKEDRLTEEMFEFISGTNDTIYRIDTLWSQAARRMKNENGSITNSTTEINRLISSNETMTDEEFTEKYLKLAEQRYDGYNDQRILVRAGESLGMDRKQMQAIVDSTQGLGNPGGMTVNHFLRDKYIPHEPTMDDAMDNFRAKGANTLSPDEKKDELRANRAVMKDRIRIIKSYRRQVQYGDFTP